MDVKEKKHYRSPEALFGEAINYVKVLDDGTMWVGNDEYETQVNFCPYTGEPAKKQMKPRLNEGKYYTRYE